MPKKEAKICNSREVNFNREQTDFSQLQTMAKEFQPFYEPQQQPMQQPQKQEDEPQVYYSLGVKKQFMILIIILL